MFDFLSKTLGDYTFWDALIAIGAIYGLKYAIIVLLVSIVTKLR